MKAIYCNPSSQYITLNCYGYKTGKAILIKELMQVEDASLLRAIKAMLHYGLVAEGRISLEQYNRELDEAEKKN